MRDRRTFCQLCWAVDLHAAINGNMWVMRAMIRHWTAHSDRTGGRSVLESMWKLLARGIRIKISELRDNGML